MTKRRKVSIGIIVAGILLLIGILWQTLPQWLPRVIAPWLPQGSQLILQGTLHWQHRALHLDGASFKLQGCMLARVTSLSLAYRHGRWLLNSERVDVDTACLSALPVDNAAAAPLALDRWQRLLPSFDLNVNLFALAPWQAYAGKLQLVSAASVQRLHYQGEKLVIEARLDKQQQLTLNRFSIVPPTAPQPCN